jgi:hypothetical protein
MLKWNMPRVSKKGPFVVAPSRSTDTDTDSYHFRRSHLTGGAQPINVHTINKGLTLLSTIVVLVYDEFGTPFYARAVLDSASEANYITENLAQTLRVRNIPVNIIADAQRKISSLI